MAISFIYVVKTISAAIDAICTAVDRVRGESKNQNCPCGTSEDDSVFRSTDLLSCTAGRETNGRPTQLMRRSCKVIVVNEGQAVRGKDVRNDCRGYLD